MATTLTWYSDTNYAFPDTTSNEGIARSWLWTFKALLQQQIVGVDNGANGTAPAGAAWTCVGSSDGTTAAMDGVDRWGTSYDASKLVYNWYSSPHSWIVLRSPNDMAGAGTGYYYLLLDCGNGNAGYLGASLSRVAFTLAGTTTHRPNNTAPAWFGNDGTYNYPTNTSANNPYYAHITRTASGAFYFVGCRQGAGEVNGGFFGVVPVQNIANNDQWPAVGAWYFGSYGDVGSSSALQSPSYWLVAARTYTSTTSGDTNNLLLTPRLGGNGVGDFSALNDATGTYSAYPIGYYTNVAGSKGVRGFFPDLYSMGNGRAVGDTVPSVGTQEYVATPRLLIPFNCGLLV